MSVVEFFTSDDGGGDDDDMFTQCFFYVFYFSLRFQKPPLELFRHFIYVVYSLIRATKRVVNVKMKFQGKKYDQNIVLCYVAYATTHPTNPSKLNRFTPKSNNNWNWKCVQNRNQIRTHVQQVIQVILQYPIFRFVHTFCLCLSFSSILSSRTRLSRRLIIMFNDSQIFVRIVGWKKWEIRTNYTLNCESQTKNYANTIIFVSTTRWQHFKMSSEILYQCEMQNVTFFLFFFFPSAVRTTNACDVTMSFAEISNTYFTHSGFFFFFNRSKS